jgi:hypothetical protein
MGRGRVRADSDAADDRYRLWIAAGGSHAGPLGLETLGGHASQCQYPPSGVPMQHYVALALDYLKRWNVGVIPPHGAPLELNADTTPIFDELGNPKGGVRSTALDVPIARHFPVNPGAPICIAMGAQENFPQEKLKELYGASAIYADRVARRAQELVLEGWLLPADAQEVIMRAKAVKFD